MDSNATTVPSIMTLVVILAGRASFKCRFLEYYPVGLAMGLNGEARTASPVASKQFPRIRPSLC